MRILLAIEALLDAIFVKAVAAPVRKSALPSKPNPVWHKETFNF